MIWPGPPGRSAGAGCGPTSGPVMSPCTALTSSTPPWTRSRKQCGCRPISGSSALDCRSVRSGPGRGLLTTARSASPPEEHVMTSPAVSGNEREIPVLAQRLADYVVLAVAPEVPLIAADYWQLSAEFYRRVHAFAKVCADNGAGSEYRGLLGCPADPAAHRAFRAAAQRSLSGRGDLRLKAAALIAEADSQIWIDHWLGERYQADCDEFGLDRLGQLPDPVRPADASASVSAIVPVRDRDRGQRLRNLLACLHALADQDFAPGQARITVVETDTHPRCRDLIEPLADRYLFAYKDGLFNKSWAVNLGLRAAGAAGESGTPKLTCVLDADILVDRSFLARNAGRFDDPAHHAHLPFRWSLSMDGPATDRAIWHRIGARAPEVASDALRGLLLRETPGACLWVRTEVLHRIGGFDERYEGWGGEDDDVAGRLGQVVSLTRFDDPLLHMDHPRPQMAHPDGRPMNEHLSGSHLTADCWTARDGFGDPGRFLPVTSGEPARGSQAARA